MGKDYSGCSIWKNTRKFTPVRTSKTERMWGKVCLQSPEHHTSAYAQKLESLKILQNDLKLLKSHLNISPGKKTFGDSRDSESFTVDVSLCGPTKALWKEMLHWL